MNKLKLFGFLFGILLLAGCSQEDLPTMPDKTQSSTRVSLQQALKNADRVFANLSGGTRTVRRVKDVQTLGSGVTRSNSSDTLYYVVNYENEGGFAVLGADTRLDKVYAIGEEGNLDMNDTITNPGLSIFFSNLPPKPYQPVDTTSKELIPFPGEGYGPWDESYKVGPYLPAAVGKWDQISPYNFFCPRKTSGRENCKVGCAALASAQIMAYYKWPQSYNGTSFNWEEMTSWNWDINGSYDLPTLLFELGKPGNLNIKYGDDESSAYISRDAIRTFQNFGYSVSGKFEKYNLSKLVDKIQHEKKPVIMVGYKPGIPYGHGWVCDGYYCDMYSYIDPITGQRRSHGDGYLFHMIWGKGGKANGYFNISDTLSVYHNYRESDDYPNSLWNEDMENEYKYTNIHFWGDVTPNK